MVEVIPIAATQVDWQIYLQSAQHILKRSLTQELDARGVIGRNLGTFIATIGELTSPGINPTTTLKEAGYYLDHVHFTFMVMASQSATMELMQQSRLLFTVAVTIHPELYLSIVSGTLAEWKNAIINCAGQASSINSRIFSNKALKYLEGFGLSQVFSNLEKKLMSDQTFALIEK